MCHHNVTTCVRTNFADSVGKAIRTHSRFKTLGVVRKRILIATSYKSNRNVMASDSSTKNLIPSDERYIPRASHAYKYSQGMTTTVLLQHVAHVQLTRKWSGPTCIDNASAHMLKQASHLRIMATPSNALRSGR